MKSLISRIGFGLLIVAIAFFGLKGCIVTIWTSPKEPTTYSVVGSDGRMLSVVFLPRSETLFVYSPDRGESLEVNLSVTKGVYGTHYFSRLWSVDGPGTLGGLLNYRIYPTGFEPVRMETTVKKKFMLGTHKPVLPAEGERTHPVILFGADKINFEGMLLEKEPTSNEFLNTLLPKLRQ